MLKKRTYTEATAEPPHLELTQAAVSTRDPVKKPKSVHFGAIQIVGQTDKTALETRVAAFNLSMAQQRYQKGCLEINRMIVSSIVAVGVASTAASTAASNAALPWEECRKQLETLRLDAEAAIRYKLHVDTKHLLREYTMTL